MAAPSTESLTRLIEQQVFESSLFVSFNLLTPPQIGRIRKAERIAGGFLNRSRPHRTHRIELRIRQSSMSIRMAKSPHLPHPRCAAHLSHRLSSERSEAIILMAGSTFGMGLSISRLRKGRMRSRLHSSREFMTKPAHPTATAGT
jgi:hypothetical protein